MMNIPKTIYIIQIIITEIMILIWIPSKADITPKK